MKGRLNTPMTEYYIEGENIQELRYVLTIYDDWLAEHGFQFKQYYSMPSLKDKANFVFLVTYNTPSQFQADAFIINLTNYKI